MNGIDWLKPNLFDMQTQPILSLATLAFLNTAVLLAGCDTLSFPSGEFPSTPPLPSSTKAPDSPKPNPAPSTPGDTPNSRPTPASASPIEFHIQFTERGDKPESKDLARTLVFPRWPYILTETTAIVYEWRPDDGKEKQANPRTGRVWGPILKDSLSEMMEQENFERHLNTMGPWLDAWVPRDFDGVVCIDIERWNTKTDPFHTPPSEISKQRTTHPGKTQGDLLFDFYSRTIERARQLRPNARSWGWYGIGGVHPGQVIWKDGYFEDSIRQSRRDSRWLKRIDTPMPVLYFPSALSDETERRLSFDRVVANYVEGFGADRLASKGYAYVNAQHCLGPRDGKTLTRSEFKECVEAGLRAGMRRFIVWASIGNRAERDELQRWIDTVLEPVARESQSR